MKIQLDNHSLESLQKGFINQGARAGKIGEDELKVIAVELERIVDNNGKKDGTFTVKTVSKIIVEKKLADYSNNQHPEQSLRTASRKALISLGIVKTKS